MNVIHKLELIPKRGRTFLLTFTSLWCTVKRSYRDLQNPVNLCVLVGGNLGLSDFVNILILPVKNSTRESN